MMREHNNKAFWLLISLIRTGIDGRCPNCEKGRLFDGYLQIANGCCKCGFDYAFSDSGDGPAAFVILIIGFIVSGLALWSEVTFDPPLWLHFILWIPLTVILSLVLLRWMKGILIVLQHHNQAAQGKLSNREEK